MRISNDLRPLTVQYDSERKDAFIPKGEISKGETAAATMEISKEGKEALALKDDKDFADEIVSLNRPTILLPTYSGIYSADKAVAAAIEGSTEEEQAFVYDIIRQNFLVENSSSMTEEERQANISLGMKKAEFAAENFISEEYRESFLNGMETIAKLASAGKVDAAGNVDYGVNEAKYLGHGSNLVYTTNVVDMMRKMDADAYKEYQEAGNQGSDHKEKAMNALKYLTNWYIDFVKKNPYAVDTYENKSEEYLDSNVKDQELDKTFSGLDTKNKSSFIQSLRAFQISRPTFLSNLIGKELSRKFWNEG